MSLVEHKFALSIRHILLSSDREIGSKWMIFLRRNDVNIEINVEYSQGAAFFRWRSRPFACQFNYESLFGKYNTKQRIKCFTGKVVESRKSEVDKFFAQYIEPEPPILDDTLYGLVSDANCVRFSQSFEEFCGELGYSTDSREAERMYHGCRDNWSKLVKLGLNLDELTEMFQDY